MSAAKEKTSGGSRPTTSSPDQSGSTRVKTSRLVQLEQATKNLFRFSIRKKDRTVPNANTAIQSGSIGVIVPQEQQGGVTLALVDTTVKDLTSLPSAIHQYPVAPTSGQPNNNEDLTPLTSITLRSITTLSTSDSSSKAAAVPVLPAPAPCDRMNIFLENVITPYLKISLPPPGVRLDTTMQLAYCNQLLRTHLSPSLAVAIITTGLDSSQQASVDALLQDKEEHNKVRELAIRVVEEFVANSLKSSEEIAEVILLGPYLDQEYYRKLLNCFIAEFEAAKLLDVDLLRGLVQLVQCAGADYLQPDDLVRVLVVLRTRLQDTHQQTTKHPYCLAIALSRLLDVMVEGKVKDLRRVVDHEPLSALLGQLMESADPYLKHQATYALQGLLHIPNDETRRQFVLRHAGNIVMGLLGVASVCNLDLNGLSDGAGKLRDTTVSALKIGGEVVSGTQSIYENGQGIAASVKGGIFSGGRLLWYSALREARGYIHNGQLADFKRLVIEAPCSRETEFQWGVCMILGEISIDPQWESTIRQHSLDFLAELYRNDTIQNANKEINQWVLSILRHIVVLSETPVSGHAQFLLQGLENEGDIGKQALYRDFMDGPTNLYPLRTHSPMPVSSPLLARVQAIPDVEYSIHRLRSQRLKERDNALYIPPQAKPTLQSSDDTLFPLMEKTLDFLAGSGQVILLLGDSGGGKSMFNLELEHTLWKAYERGGAIPLHINLPAIDNPQQNMITKQLQQLNFSDVQIQELKQHRQFVVICDGYDESQLKKNIYATNLLNQPGQWTAKMVISCRSQYLGSDYRTRFQPTGDRYQRPIVDLFQEVVIASFSRSQIEQYVEQFVQKAPSQAVAVDPSLRSWTVNDYMVMLNYIPNMIELVSNPFLLTLALKTLPRIVLTGENLSDIRITRIGLFDNFVEEWLETNKLRLETSTLSREMERTFEALLDEGFVQQGVKFLKDLATAIFQHQNGTPVVEYSHVRESKTWKAMFFGLDAQATLLRESSPLVRSGNKYQFLHRSIMEYLNSRVMSDPFGPSQLSEHSGFDATESVESFLDHPLNQRSIVTEPSILLFLAERTGLDPLFKSSLFAAVEESKVDVRVSQAAANAISIMIKAGVQFNGADLRGIKIPGADIYGGQFDSANLEGADLSNVNMSKAWLRQANLKGAQMGGVQFGELPYLTMGEMVMRCVFSSDGELLAASTENHKIVVYNTTTWAKIADYVGGHAIAISPTTRELARAGQDNDVELSDILTGETRLVLKGHGGEVSHIAYSLDGSLITTASVDTTIRVWSTESGNSLHVLEGDAGAIKGIAFSPNGFHLVTCSEDKIVRTWDVRSGESLLTLEAHGCPVRSVSYSPDGHQIASADTEGTTILWDAYTGNFIRALKLYGVEICCVAYSPDGHQIATCGLDSTIRIWNPHSGEIIGTLSGHLRAVFDTKYSPNGNFIASGSVDGTVRLWEVERVLSSATSGLVIDGFRTIDISPDGLLTVTGNPSGVVQLWETQTGKPGLVLLAHSEYYQKVLFSPCGERVASTDMNGTIRLWCAQTGESVHCFESHKLSNLDFTFSPNGRQIATSGKDNTVRVWDARTGKPSLILEGHTDAIKNLAYSPSGDQIASCSNDQTIRLWCSLTGKQVKILLHNRAVDQVAFSPGGQELVSYSSQGGGFCCWDLQTDELIEQLPTSTHLDTCFSFSPCGKFIVSGALDGVLRLWSRALGKWSEVFRSSIGRLHDVCWRQGSNGRMYLATLSFIDVSVWELSESRDPYKLRLLWRTGKDELSMDEADMCGAVGLSTADLALVKQRGGVTEPESETDALAQDKLGLMYELGRGVEKSYVEAVKWYTKAAEQGDADAQCHIGLMYKQGRGVEQSDVEAAKWFSKAVDQGDGYAQINLGLAYYHGSGVEQSDIEAVRWFTKAAEQENAAAQSRLGWMYDEGRGVEQSDVEAVKWYTKAVEKGDALGQLKLGLMYEKGRGVEQSDVEAVKWYIKAAEQGNAVAQSNLGLMYDQGRGVEQSQVEAVKWNTKAVEQGEAVAQYNHGLMCYQGRGVEQSYVEAAMWFTKAAEQGYPSAQFYLGVMYALGLGVELSDIEAVNLITKAADQGNADAQFNLGKLYEEGLGVEQSDVEAAKWYTKAAEQGNVAAQVRLGLMYDEGRGVEQSDVEVVKWFTKVAEQGDAAAQFNVALMYEQGRGVEQSDVEAVKWYIKAAEQGEVLAQFNLGMLYEEGRGVEQSYVEAAMLFTKAAEQGNVVAQVCIGLMYEQGRGVEQSDIEAVKWYTKAAEQGNAVAQAKLGWMYDEGRGVEQSDIEAVKWYIKAAEQGEVLAQFNLGMMYEEGQGVEQSDVEAAFWYTKVAEQGNVVAQVRIGLMYNHGKGVEQSDVEAVKWYTKAVEQGDAPAQVKLGLMYEQGRGVEQSYVEAAMWYTKAAEQGNADAQSSLGKSYEQGQGVEQSDVEAVKWYTKAVEQGEAVAQFNLGLMYEQGRGVEQSHVEAVNLITKAADQGNADAQFNLGESYEGQGVEQSDVEEVK